MKKLLFLCSQNKFRSPTAEIIFGEYDRLETASAGLEHDATNPLTPELLEWADIIFVMEKSHRNQLSKKFKPYLTGKKVISLNIPDEYDYMSLDLIDILKRKVLLRLSYQ